MKAPALRRHLGAGDILFREGERPDYAYVLEGGLLKVCLERDGRMRDIGQINPGEIFGELSLIEKGPRVATIVAAEPSIVQCLEPGHLERQVEQLDPLLRHVVQLGVKRLRSLIARAGREALPAAEPAEPLARLQRALTNNEFVLHYQPIVRMQDGAVAGFEALVRWHDPERGLVMPEQFIPLAEQSGLIIPMGRWIVETAAAALAHLGADGAPLFMAVNLSARQFVDGELVRTLAAAIARNRIAPGALRLEITESSLFQRMDEAAALMRDCARLGVKLSVDDFGTGYSALSYLYKMPVSQVKLAKPFIHDLADFPDSAKIVGAVSRLAREMSMETVAEGIELPAHAEAVRALGVEYGQGFHYSKALPLLAAGRYLWESRHP